MANRTEPHPLTGRTAADVTEWLTHLREGQGMDAEALTAILARARVDDHDSRLPDSAGPTVLYVLGEGAMGEVHAAFDPGLRRFVAIKRMKPTQAADTGMIARFAQEALITAQLDHPGIVPVYALGRDAQGVPAYTMKLVRGLTLDRYLKRAREGRPDPLPARIELALRVAKAIQYAHSRGVIHRDLKPENIMVGEFGEVLVMDWGLARTTETDEGERVDVGGLSSESTTSGSVVGTPRYMSPEAALGLTERVGRRSDVYSLGLILQELVTLRPAIAGDTRDEVLERAARGALQPVRPVSGERLSKDLRAVLAKATSLALKDRYQDAGSFAADLTRLLRDEAVGARREGPVGRMARWISQNRELTLAMMLVMVLATVAMMVFAASSGIIALETMRHRAAEREARVEALLSTVARQTSRINDRFQGYEKLLAGLSAASVQALMHPPERERIWMAGEFGNGSPPDLVASPFYRGPTSLDHLDHVAAPGVSAEAVRADLLRLEGLQPVMREALLRSGGDALLRATDWRGRILGGSLPMVWAYVATPAGTLSGYPGTGRYPSDYDPREQEWYRRGTDAEGRAARWGPATPDESDMGLLTTASQPLFAPDGRFLGVAAVDISIDRIASDLLPPVDLAAPVSTWLVDAEGRVVASSTVRADSSPGATFPWPEVLSAVRAGRSSGSVPAGEELIAWSTLGSLGWVYAIVGPRRELIGE